MSAVDWKDEELVSKGFRGKHHVVTVALGRNDLWSWSAWGERNFRLASGVADTREDAKIGAVRIGLHPRLTRK